VLCCGPTGQKTRRSRANLNRYGLTELLAEISVLAPNYYSSAVYRGGSGEDSIPGANENIGDKPAQKSVVASLQSAAADAGDDVSGGVLASALLP
jgi:hypothetical protein